MEAVPALQAAIDLVHAPSQAGQARLGALPNGMQILLRIAAGDDDAIQMAARTTGRPPDVLRHAAAFFIEQILLASDTDSYRVLGATADASAAELRRNMALLLRWLHPDHTQSGGRSVFATRVTQAWDDLKTQERRSVYDTLHAQTRQKRLQPEKKASRRQRTNSHARKYSPGQFRRRSGPAKGPLVVIQQRKPPGLLRRLLLALFGKATS